MLRRVKLAYEVYNFFRKKELEHNIDLFRKYGVKKKYYSSISSEDFKNIDQEKALDTSGLKSVKDISFYQEQDAETQKSIDSFEDEGFCIIRNFLNAENVKSINDEIERLLDAKEIEFKYNSKLMFAIHKSKVIRDLCSNHKLDELLNTLIRGKAKLFQSINFKSGSEQDTHSDSIHMTTFPLGGLLGVWIALEDITLKNGPVHYYPRSHKLPYYMNRDYDNVGGKFLLGDKGYAAYEKMIDQKVEEQNIQKIPFLAKAGDMFIWHANLLHGGEPHLDKSKTRKSMVLHYFDSNRICYHEITQRPALIKNYSQ